jgi:hypothetical protein
VVIDPFFYVHELEATHSEENIEALFGITTIVYADWCDDDWCKFLNCTLDELPDKMHLPDDVPPVGYVNYYDELSDEPVFVTPEQESLLDELWEHAEIYGDELGYGDEMFDPYQMALEESLPASRSAMFSTPVTPRSNVVPMHRPPTRRAPATKFPKKTQPAKVKHHFEIVR